ncbi:MAG: hypothetical protein EAX86_06925 [Candidatus Heimdallarchaeota archaeon]|nr:hypothetical protein [Candidatus Heimdallarchaeota archaeon]
MNKEIYYFSGTGNSLVVAQDLALELNGKLISIPSVMDRVSIKSEADVIGIIFPVYFAAVSGIPLIVKQFLDKLENLSTKYVFAVCTHKGGPGSTIENLREMIRNQGGDLAAGFTVQLSIPPSPLEKMRRVFLHQDLRNFDPGNKDSPQLQLKVAKWKRKLEIITNYVSNFEEGWFETPGRLWKTIMAPYNLFMRFMYSVRYKQLSEVPNLPFTELIHLADKSFKVNEKCNGCGICARVCPVRNIEVVNTTPIWLHHCENCIACFEWCPKDAIEGEIVAYERKFHHQQVKLRDMLKPNISQ